MHVTHKEVVDIAVLTPAANVHNQVLYCKAGPILHYYVILTIMLVISDRINHNIR